MTKQLFNTRKIGEEGAPDAQLDACLPQGLVRAATVRPEALFVPRGEAALP